MYVEWCVKPVYVIKRIDIKVQSPFLFQTLIMEINIIKKQKKVKSDMFGTVFHFCLELLL